MNNYHAKINMFYCIAWFYVVCEAKQCLLVINGGESRASFYMTIIIGENKVTIGIIVNKQIVSLLYQFT